MCKQCQIKPVYEFTNRRKLCKRCFINYFQKKVLYAIRKFHMIKKSETVFYRKRKDFKGVVLSEILNFVADKAEIRLNSGKREKIALDSSIDSEADSIIKTLISGNVSELKKFLPIYKNAIKPLYLFLDKEILLYAKLRNLKFKKEKNKRDRIKSFENKFEKKHPEVKRAIVNSVLALHQNSK